MMSDDLSILRAVAIGAISSRDGVVILRIECLPSGSESPEDVQVVVRRVGCAPIGAISY